MAKNIKCTFLLYIVDISDDLASVIKARLMIHCRLSTILKAVRKEVYEVIFWYLKVFLFWKCIQYTIHYGKTEMLSKFPSIKTNRTKNALFLLSQAPTHHSFTFNLRFLFEVKHKVRLSKTVCGIPFRFC